MDSSSGSRAAGGSRVFAGSKANPVRSRFETVNSREFSESPTRSASQMQSLLGESFGKTQKNGEAFRKVPR